jgi:hypothetical protein
MRAHNLTHPHFLDTGHPHRYQVEKTLFLPRFETNLK